MQPVEVFRARLTAPLPPGGSRERLTIYATTDALYDLEPALRGQVRTVEDQRVIQLQFGHFRIFRGLTVNSSCLTLQTEGDTRSSLFALTHVDEAGLPYGVVLETEHLKSGSRWLYGEVAREPLFLRRYAMGTMADRRAKSFTRTFQKDARELRERVRLLAPK
jgi:hypothetical protein